MGKENDVMQKILSEKNIVLIELLKYYQVLTTFFKSLYIHKGEVPNGFLKHNCLMLFFVH